MAAIDILAPRAYTVDLNISCSPTLSADAFPRSYSEKLSWTNALVNGLISSSPPTARTLHGPRPVEADEKPSDEPLFPDLPPLHIGRPTVHMRSGVMNSARLAASLEPDAEKAFFVADLSQVYMQHMRWKKNLPEIEPFYGEHTFMLPWILHAYSLTALSFAAVKCNPDPYVIRLLAALGTGFDCASNGEISQVLAVGGIAPSRIIFANPCKATSFVRNAARAGVDLMTFDNTDELHKIARVFPRARLVLRILTDDSQSLCRLGLKFGAPLQSVPGLLAQARALGLDVVGVSFHVGSGSFDTNAFADAIARARLAFDAGAAAGYQFSLLDVGGGFEHADFEPRAAVLREAIAMHFPDRRERGIRVIAEPGRFYVSKAFSLAANIIARRAPMADGSVVAPPSEADAEQPSVMCASLHSASLVP